MTGPCHIRTRKYFCEQQESEWHSNNLPKKKKKNADTFMRGLKFLWLGKSGSLGGGGLLFLFGLSPEAYEKTGLSISMCGVPLLVRDRTRDFGQAWDSAVLAMFTPLLLIKGENDTGTFS